MFEKEAEEYVMREDVITENDRVPFNNGYGFQTVSFEDEVKKGFKDGAEFGYNKGKAETALLSQHILDLQKDKGNLTDKVRELEQQIAELKEKLEITDLALDNCLKDSEVKK